MGRKRAQSTDQRLSKLDHLSTIDRISDLPWHILDNILCRLPIMEVMRTSILSRQWRYYWTNLSELVIDLNKLGHNPDRISFIYHTLLNHHGSVNSFKLYTFFRPVSCNLDSWILFLGKNGIRRLTLKFDCFSEEPYKVHFSLFSCQELTHLYLKNVLLGTPTNFTGFESLVELELSTFSTNTDETTDIEGLTRFLGSCANLKTLILVEFEISAPFNIRAPKLEYLFLRGAFAAICIQNCPSLAEIIFLMNDIPQKFPCTLLQDLSLLPNLKSLEVYSNYLEDVSERRIVSCNQFEFLEMHKVSLRNPHEMGGALKVLKLFSNSQELHVSLEAREDDYDFKSGFLEELSQFNCSFDLLRAVSITIHPCDELEDVCSISSWNPELEFIKYILAHSSVLEKMILVSNERVIKDERLLMKELISSGRASEQAKIEYHACQDLE